MKYRTIVADPPWPYRSGDILTRGKVKPAHVGRSSKMVEGQYATMTWEEIAALPIGDLAADSAHLYLWITNPMLYGGSNGGGGKPSGLTPRDLLAEWGFTYQTLLTWVKTGTLGMGFYFRGMTEHVIFATRKKCPIAPEMREPNVISAPRRGHSEKPDCFFDLVERVSPGPYLEMFARSARMSFGEHQWDYWGDQSLGTAELPQEAA